MERPFSFASEDIRDEKVRPDEIMIAVLDQRAAQVKTLRYIKPISPDHALLGQYVGDGQDKPGYLDDETVPKGSHCPTFAAEEATRHLPFWEQYMFPQVATISSCHPP